MRAMVGAQVRGGAVPVPVSQSSTDSGLRFPGVADTSATLIGGPSNTAITPTVIGSPATWIALAAAGYLLVAYLCFHHY